MSIHFHVMFLLIYLVCPCRQQRKHSLVVCAKKLETQKIMRLNHSFLPCYRLRLIFHRL